jgi:hypothetical protein
MPRARRVPDRLRRAGGDFNLSPAAIWPRRRRGFTRPARGRSGPAAEVAVAMLPIRHRRRDQRPPAPRRRLQRWRPIRARTPACPIPSR